MFSVARTLRSRAARGAVVLAAAAPLAAVMLPAQHAKAFTEVAASQETARAASTASVRAAVAHPELTYAVGSQGMVLAQQIAREYWGMDACGGQVAISWTVQDDYINAVSTWSNPVSSYGAPAQNSNCSIAFNVKAPFDWNMFCTV